MSPRSSTVGHPDSITDVSHRAAGRSARTWTRSQSAAFCAFLFLKHTFTGRSQHSAGGNCDCDELHWAEVETSRIRSLISEMCVTALFLTPSQWSLITWEHLNVTPSDGSSPAPCERRLLGSALPQPPASVPLCATFVSINNLSGS